MVRDLEAGLASKSRARKPVLMELVGPAAAGKSTLSRALARCRGNFVEGHDISLLKVEHLLLFLRSLPRLRPILLSQFGASRHFTWDEIKSLVYLQAWTQVLGRQGAEQGVIVLIDQGPVFRLATLLEFGPEGLRSATAGRWWHEVFAEWGSVLDLVIWLDAPDPVLEERINTRSTRHLVKGKSKSEMEEFLARYRRSYQYTLKKLAMSSGERLLCFDTSLQSTDDILREVLSAYGISAAAN